MVALNELWTRMARLDEGWRVSVEARHAEQARGQRWRVDMTRREVSHPATIIIEDDTLETAMARAVCAAEAQDGAAASADEARRARLRLVGGGAGRASPADRPGLSVGPRLAGGFP